MNSTHESTNNSTDIVKQQRAIMYALPFRGKREKGTKTEKNTLGTSCET